MAAGYNFNLNVLVKGLGGVTQLQGSLSRLDKQGATLANTFRVVRAALVAFGGAQVIGRAIELEKTIERTRLSLNSLTGSLAAGNQAYQNAAKFSSEYGFQLDKTLKATQELLLSGKSLNEIPEIMRQLGGVSRATGADIDTLSDEFIKLRITGAASAKTLGPLLERHLGKTVYDAVKNNGELSLQYFKQLGPQLGDALTSGMGGMNKALNDLQLNADKFVQAFLGTDNADKMQTMAKALAFVTENMVAFKLALAAVVALLFGPAGWIIGLGLAASALLDLDDKLKKSKYISNAWSTGVDDSIPKLDEQGNAIAHNAEQTAKLSEVTQQVVSDFTDYIETMGNVTVGTTTVTAALSELEQQEKAMRISLGNTLVEIEKQFSTLNIMTDVLKSGFTNIGNAATEAFVGIIKGTMTARDAGRMLADAIVTELITAFVRLFIVGPIMAFIASQLGMVVDSEHETARAVERTNRALQKQIGLRLILMALGFAKGGPVQAGGQPAARALGGPTSGNMPYMVGERGPELFVPNNSGTIVPNDRLNFGSGMETEMGRGNSANITFNINTLDARDFDNLLTTRQDLIISLINRGLTERGKARLV
jgi:hypothetical protein